MDFTLIIFIAMMLTFMGACFKFKLPVGVAMMLSAIAGLITSGNGFSIRHLVEGSFGYLDSILVIATAMIFMKSVTASGVLSSLNFSIVKKFHKNKIVLLIVLMFFIMFPGMVTGSSTASVLTAGALVAPILISMGIPMVETASILAIGSMLGMIAPPVNIPAMVIGGGVDMPYTGFEIPLLMLTIPIAIFSALYLGKKHLRDIDLEKLEKELGINKEEKVKATMYLPLILLIILMVGSKIYPNTLLNLGLPLTFMLCAILALFTGKKFNIYKVAKEGVHDVLPVLSILIGVGMFIQVMTLTGVRGYIVLNALSLPMILLYVAIAITLPLFGSVSSYAAASVLGVPFLMTLITKNQIITASALSLIAALGDLMPPTALAGLFAAQVVGVKDYKLVLKKCIVPALMFIAVGLLAIVFANPLSEILF